MSFAEDHAPLWLCSGQSNMLWPFAWMPEAAKRDQLAQLASGPLCVARIPDRAWIDRDTPLPSAVWQTELHEDLPALPAFLSQKLSQQSGSLQRMLVSALGGSRIDCWIPRAASEPPEADTPAHAEAHRRWQVERAAFDRENQARTARGDPPIPCTPEMFRGPPGPRSRFYPGGAFAAMIRPLAERPFQGVIWYQGESDAECPEGYADRLSRLIQSWRRTFRKPNLPFFIVGLPHYGGDEHAVHWPVLREQQRHVAESLPACQVVDCSDLGEADNIHPSDKTAVAERVVSCILKHHIPISP